MKEAVDPRSAEGREQQDLLQSQILQIVRTLRKTSLRRETFFLRAAERANVLRREHYPEAALRLSTRPDNTDDHQRTQQRQQSMDP